MQQEWLPSVLLAFWDQYFTPSLCLPPQRLLHLRQGSSIVRLWMDEKGSYEGETGRIKQAWSPTTGIFSSEQFQGSAPMKAEGLKTKHIPQNATPRLKTTTPGICLHLQIPGSSTLLKPWTGSFVPIKSKRQDRDGFLNGSAVKNLPASAGDMGSIPDLGRSHMPQSN